ncbi:F0F1 ATP synthase subunit delta [Gammaproteobacteria bacterium]|nr:F0F1 ATP synthase subunit delta [Gammaproteobacteria bacterium]
MSIDNSVGRPYAEAAFQLAVEQGKLDHWQGLLGQLAELVEEPDVARLIANPLVDADATAGVIGAALKFDEKSPEMNLVNAMASQERLAVMPSVVRRFAELRAEHDNEIDAVIEVAMPTEDAQLEILTKALEKRFGRKVRVRTEVNEHLIAGAVIRTGDTVIDGSLREQLSRMSGSLSA